MNLSGPRRYTHLPLTERSARDILTMIDRWALTASYNERQRLWDVLTALRGPDTKDSSAVKYQTTARIRRAAFPRWSAFQSPAATMGVHGRRVVSTKSIAVANTMSGHFGHHIEQARDALVLMGLSTGIAED